MNLLNRIKLNKTTIIIIGILGMFLMFIGGGRTDQPGNITEEDRLVNILSHIEGAGEVKVMLSLSDDNKSLITKTDSSRYIGAVVLAEGGGRSIVREKIIKAVKAVTGLETHKIVVYRLET